MWLNRNRELVRTLSDRRSLVIKTTQRGVGLYARGNQGDLLIGRARTIDEAKQDAQSHLNSLKKTHTAKQGVSTQGETDMCETYPGFDLGYRPAGYFWPMDLATHLLATVKGAERRKHVQALIDAGRLDQLEDFDARSGLSAEIRDYIGRIHPRFMGGEYLPDLAAVEVEIARITLASTLQDVVSVRARKGRVRILYRVVDEYNGDTLTGRNTRNSSRPLSLGQLVDFLDGAWPMRDVIAMNGLEDSPEGMLDFVSVSSPFYPELYPYYARRFQAWAAEARHA